MSNNDISKVAERLRASKEEADESMRESGLEPGRRWAKENAGFYELKRAAEAFGELDADLELDPVLLLKDVLDDEDVDFGDFWRAYFGEETPETEQIVGFLEGATEVWDQVRDEV